MIIRLAESLELSLADRNGLLMSAGFAPVFPSPTSTVPNFARCATRSMRSLPGTSHIPPWWCAPVARS